MRLQGEIAIVTGAGRGIGKEIALALAAEGASIAAVARTLSDLEQTVAEIKEAGGDAIALSRDLTDISQVQSMVDAVVEKYGKIDILVNNAGGYPKEIYDITKNQAIKIWDWSEEQWDQIIKTNLKIPFLCTNKVIPEMIKQKKGLLPRWAHMPAQKPELLLLQRPRQSRHRSTVSVVMQLLQQYWTHRDKGLIIILLDKMKLRWETQTVWARPLFI